MQVYIVPYCFEYKGILLRVDSQTGFLNFITGNIPFQKQLDRFGKSAMYNNAVNEVFQKSVQAYI